MPCLPNSIAFQEASGRGGDSTVTSTSSRGSSFPATANYNLSYVGAFLTIGPTAQFVSSGTWDGFVLESSQVSGVGGSVNASAKTARLGDDAANRQAERVARQRDRPGGAAAEHPDRGDGDGAGEPLPAPRIRQDQGPDPLAQEDCPD